MLLNFNTKNYKSFAEEAHFSMIAAPKQRDLSYSLLKETVNKKNIRGLCSSVVYGPNAAGKTNLIGAMEVLRAIVLRGNIRNAEVSTGPNAATRRLELIPNSKKREPEPVFFCIEFTEDVPSQPGKKFKIRYSIEIDLGIFLDESYPRKIRSEVLYINDDMIFERKDGLHISEMNVIRGYLSDAVEQELADLDAIAEQSLNDEELFLSNGFKLMYSQDIVKLIIGWFEKKFTVVYRANAVQLTQRYPTPDKETVYVEEEINKAAKIFGMSSHAVGYAMRKDGSEPKMVSLVETDGEQSGKVLPAEFFESYGTIRFMNIFPLLTQAMQTGGTLVIDEFDASLHPMALMSIVSVFHNDEINIHHAQLIFNTHNPIFLNSNLFRRDEIKFVECEDDRHGSTIYALSDFKTSGSDGVRKGDDYLKNYFVSRYGAIKDVDFSPIFEELLGIEDEA